MRFTIVACRNADGLHSDSKVEYLLYMAEWGKEIIRNPSYSLLRELIPKGEQIKLVWRPCDLCRSRGINGFAHIPDENLPLDPFEEGKEGGQ